MKLVRGDGSGSGGEWHPTCQLEIDLFEAMQERRFIKSG